MGRVSLNIVAFEFVCLCPLLDLTLDLKISSRRIERNIDRVWFIADAAWIQYLFRQAERKREDVYQKHCE